VDLNGDGNIDLLGAGFAGFSYILYGKDNGLFNEAILLQDKSGANIILSNYYDFNVNKYITLGSNEKSDKGDFVKAHDWDNDGDLDLLISGRKGVYLRINEGTKTKPVFGTNNIKVLPAYYADAIIDWDGDGLWDILGGSKNGGVYFYKNTGNPDSPIFSEAICLFTPEDFINKTNGGKCGITQIAVADYNNDGKFDLLIGNNNSINKKMLKLTAEQIKERDLLRKKLTENRKKSNAYYYDKLKNEFGNNQDKLREALKNDEYHNELGKKWYKIYQKLNKFKPESKAHGYIWVSLRK
jgi:hypothetical protein